MTIRLNNLKCSAWLQDRPGNHSFLQNNDRPMLGVNLYNNTDQPITITIPPKTAAYCLGMFANEKYAGTQYKVSKDHVTVKLPLNAGAPVFNSATPKPKT